MPRISTFYGIVIAMYVGREHPPPHFHALYAEFEAQVALDGTILNASLPPRAAALVKEWAALHTSELADNWRRAMARQAVASIDPLP